MYKNNQKWVKTIPKMGQNNQKSIPKPKNGGRAQRSTLTKTPLEQWQQGFGVSTDRDQSFLGQPNAYSTGFYKPYVRKKQWIVHNATRSTN